jgi:hypothetical protein
MEMAMRDESKRYNERDIFAWETAVATIWTLLIAVFLIGSTYNRLGRPALDATTQAEAAVTSSTANPSKGWGGSGGLLPVFYEELW